MQTSLLIAAVIAAELLGAPAAAAGPVRRVAQSAPQATAAGRQLATDRATSGVARLLGQRDQRVVEKRSLSATYARQLAELDRLKQSKASWRRDRQIRAKKAESQATAARLSRVDAELRVLDAQLKVQRESLLAAIARELADGSASPTRRAVLERLRGQIAAVLRPRARRIILPDDSLDELADPEELAEQIALIAQAEKELAQERQVLRQREERYTRWAVLRDQRERAGQMSDLDDEQVRRSTGRTGKAGRDNGGGGSTAEDDQGDSASPGAGGAEPPAEDPSDGGSPPPSGPDASFDTSSVVLADVVDSSTIDALKRAGRSSNPRARADAAQRARKQVEQRLERLKKSRALIQNHLNKLRSQ
ncbi:MAG TPA: hypothetical protein VIG06_07870 [Kofleriaceae bacterium]